LSAIVYREDGVWVAHCLELDIVAEGEDAEDATCSLISLCELQIKVALEEGDLKAVFRPAPPEIWKMFWTGTEKKGCKRLRVEAPIDRFEARELVLA